MGIREIKNENIDLKQKGGALSNEVRFFCCQKEKTD